MQIRPRQLGAAVIDVERAIAKARNDRDVAIDYRTWRNLNGTVEMHLVLAAKVQEASP